MTAPVILLIGAMGSAPTGGSGDLGAQQVAPAVEEMARAFVQKAPEHPPFSLQITVEGEGTWSVTFAGEGGHRVSRGPAERPAFRFSTTPSFFGRLARGEIVGMTAMGQATPDDPVPLDMTPGEGASDIDDFRALFLQVAMHFFNPEVPGRVDLSVEGSRVVHGASVVGLFYHEGFRSGWYRVLPGQQLNEPGDTNPFPQAFVVIGGSGQLTIGDRTVRVRGGAAYFIPPGSSHVVVADEESYVELLWLAWGEGA